MYKNELENEFINVDEIYTECVKICNILNKNIINFKSSFLKNAYSLLIDTDIIMYWHKNNNEIHIQTGWTDYHKGDYHQTSDIIILQSDVNYKFGIIQVYSVLKDELHKNTIDEFTRTFISNGAKELEKELLNNQKK